MNITDTDGNVVDDETGEIVAPAGTHGIQHSGAIEPTAVHTSAEVAQLPTTLAELIATFGQTQPSHFEVAQWVLEPDMMEQNDPEESARAILARILMSETADDVLKSRDVTHAQDILGEAIQVDSVTWQRSDHQQASSCYVVMHGKSLNDDRSMVITCGGRNVMMQLLKLDMIGAFPVKVRIEKSRKATANGYWPLWMELA